MNSISKLFTLLAAVLIGTLAATSVNAQQGQGRGGPPDRGGRGGFRLDEKQRNLLRESFQNTREESQALSEKLRAAQKELLKAVVAEKMDEAVVQEKAEAVAKIQVQITMLRAKGFAVIVPTLTPEQREQMLNSPFAAMMLSGGFGGGMRGPMDRGGRGGRGGAQGRGGRGGQGGQGGQGGGGRPPR